MQMYNLLYYPPNILQYFFNIFFIKLIFNELESKNFEKYFKNRGKKRVKSGKMSRCVIVFLRDFRILKKKIASIKGMVIYYNTMISDCNLTHYIYDYMRCTLSSLDLSFTDKLFFCTFLHFFVVCHCVSTD